MNIPTVGDLQDIIEPIIAKRVGHVSAQGVDCPVCFSALEAAEAVYYHLAISQETKEKPHD